MAKKSKGAAIFWGIAAIIWELIFMGIVMLGVMFGEAPWSIFFVCIVPLIIGGFMIYFLVQRLREIDNEAAHADEYDKY